MTETAWTHLEIVAAIVIPFLLFWLKSEKDRKKNWDEFNEVQQARHIENRERLRTIETMLQPIWEWWVELKRNGGRHE